MYQAGLVLEGGGMKGIYTAGVLDFFLEKNIMFSHCYGVSAGACHLCSYLSRQKGRAYRVMVDYLGMKSYCSKYSLFTTGNLFGKDMCYDLIPNYLDPYDFESFEAYRGKAYAVATDIRTGKPAYFPLTEMHRDIEAVRASSSLPLVSRNVKIDGGLYLDGGISDSIPIRRAIEDGNQKNIVVLTKAEGFRRQPSKHLELMKLRYLKYPKVYELMKRRHIEYNQTLDYLEEQVKAKRALVLRPQRDRGIGRIEKDREKLTALYQEGYREAEERCEEIMAYLTEGERAGG